MNVGKRLPRAGKLIADVRRPAALAACCTLSDGVSTDAAQRYGRGLEQRRTAEPSTRVFRSARREAEVVACGRSGGLFRPHKPDCSSLVGPLVQSVPVPAAQPRFLAHNVMHCRFFTRARTPLFIIPSIPVEIN